MYNKELDKKDKNFMALNNDQPEETFYDEEELEYFKKRLAEEHNKTKEKIQNMENSLANLESNSQDENSAAAHHQGDIGTEEDDREKFLIMLEKEAGKLDEITAALGRIDRGTYGICEETGKKISRGRLEAIPYTRYSIDAAK
jgi:RNA polymerase-binding protein DksA